jgi:hypothetical protein
LRAAVRALGNGISGGGGTLHILHLPQPQEFRWHSLSDDL